MPREITPEKEGMAGGLILYQNITMAGIVFEQLVIACSTLNRVAEQLDTCSMYALYEGFYKTVKTVSSF